MSHLYLRGRAVYIRYKNAHGRTLRRKTGYTLDRVRKDPKGRTIWPGHIRDFQTKLDANLVLRTWDFSQPKPGMVTISEALIDYHAGEGGTRAKQTLLLDKDAVRHFVAFAGDLYLVEISEDVLYPFREHAVRTISEQSAARILRHLSGLLGWCVRRRLIDRNPISAGVKVNPPRKAVVSFTNDELERVLSYIADQGDPEMSRQLRFLALTGFRSHESCQLRWEMVDFGQRLISHYNEKGKRMEPFPLDETLVVLLRASLRDYDPFVFKYRNVSTLSRRMRTALNDLGLDRRLNVHALKKTYVRQLVESGVPLPLLHTLAHHASLSTTVGYYVAFDLDAKRRALEASRTKVGTKMTQAVILKGPSRKK